jgi:putative endonuclease
MYFFYTLQSERTLHFYLGQPNRLRQRFDRRQAGQTWTGKRSGPWRLVYWEKYGTRAEAVRRERELKSWKRYSALEKLIREERRRNRDGLRESELLPTMPVVGG